MERARNRDVHVSGKSSIDASGIVAKPEHNYRVFTSTLPRTLCAWRSTRLKQLLRFHHIVDVITIKFRTLWKRLIQRLLLFISRIGIHGRLWQRWGVQGKGDDVGMGNKDDGRKILSANMIKRVACATNLFLEKMVYSLN